MYDVGHSVPCEFGASEAGAKDEGNVGNENFYKLPRVLKDMLDCLLERKDERVSFDQRSASVRTVGFLHSGLAYTSIELDRPTTYISRVKRHKTIEISSNISQFGSTVILALMATWTCCRIVKEVLNIISSDNNNNDDDEVTSWLDTCLEKPVFPLAPVTSSSTDNTSKKKLRSQVGILLNSCFHLLYCTYSKNQ
ncbi:unnamed protein product [Mucor circinelloides]